MTDALRPRFENKLLLSLSESDLQMLLEHLQPVNLPSGYILAQANQPSDYTYFLNRGIASVIIEGPEARATEVSMFGREGCGPVNAILATASLPFKSVIQVPGAGLRIANAHLVSAQMESMTLRHTLVRYSQALAVQTAFTAYANANFNIQQRLARWLLMCHDRICEDGIEITHKFLSTMLSARRQSVTTALHVLEGHRLILSSRKLIRILNRRGLEEMAGDSYGQPEREYQSLFPGVHA